MLLNILQCTGQLLITRNYLAQLSTVLRLRNADLNEYNQNHPFCKPRLWVNIFTLQPHPHQHMLYSLFFHTFNNKKHISLLEKKASCWLDHSTRSWDNFWLFWWSLISSLTSHSICYDCSVPKSLTLDLQIPLLCR